MVQWSLYHSQNVVPNEVKSGEHFSKRGTKLETTCIVAYSLSLKGRGDNIKNLVRQRRQYKKPSTDKYKMPSKQARKFLRVLCATYNGFTMTSLVVFNNGEAVSLNLVTPLPILYIKAKMVSVRLSVCLSVQVPILVSGPRRTDRTRS
jgi:hypothetical protein